MGVFFGASRLRKAIKSCDMQKLEKLLQAGADPNERDSFEPGPLELAVREKNLAAVEILLQYKADCWASTFYNWGHGGPIFCAAIHSDCYHIAEAMLKAHPDCVTRLARSGKTALHYAAAEGNLEGVMFLINHGADPLQKSEAKRHALYYARDGKHDELIEYLVPYFEKTAQPKALPPSSDYWQKQGDMKIAHIWVDPVTGFKITDCFNFAVNERTIIHKNLVEPVQSSETRPFDQHSPAAIAEAAEQLKSRDGLKDYTPHSPFKKPH